jgi:hypothetical protein
MQSTVKRSGCKSKKSMRGGNPVKKTMKGGFMAKPMPETPKASMPHMQGGAKSKKSTKSHDDTAWCMQCKKKVSVHDGKVGPMKRKGGKTGKMLRGNCEKGHKVVKIVG